MVSDGMGGYNAGEMASKNATEFICWQFTRKLLSRIRSDSEKNRQEMVTAFNDAHNHILELSSIWEVISTAMIHICVLAI